MTQAICFENFASHILSEQKSHVVQVPAKRAELFCGYVLGKSFDPQECGDGFMSMFLDVQTFCVGVCWGGGM